MNVIFVMTDSLRQDHLSCYGNGWINTPNLAKLAQSSAVFDRAYIASHASLPARLDLYTGRYTFLNRSWSPLDAQDIILPEIIADHVDASMLIFDTASMGQDSYNFMRGFDGWEMSRGQHTDRWRTYPLASAEWPAAPHKLKNLDRTVRWARHKALWRYESDYVTPRTFTAAIEWLERNKTVDGFLLWIDSLSPHEPFDPPQHYIDRYADSEYNGERVIYPQYGRSTYMTDTELEHVKALYAAEVTFVDRWVGQLLDKVEQLGLLDNTLIICTSDHGHLFGEHGLQGKPGGVLGNLYEVTTRIPLLVRHPEGLGAGMRIPGIVQLPDLLPTMLEFLDVPVPETVQGRSVWPLVNGETDTLHEYAISGRYPYMLDEVRPADRNVHYDRWVNPGGLPEALTVTGQDWSLVCSPRGRPSELYNLQVDPEQKNNVIAEQLPLATQMQQALLAFMRTYGGRSDVLDLWTIAPEEMVQPTEGARPEMRLEHEVFEVEVGSGYPIAFLSQGEASKRLAVAESGLATTATSFGTILERDPQSLVYVNGQYYWAQDLA